MSREKRERERERERERRAVVGGKQMKEKTEVRVKDGIKKGEAENGWLIN